MVGPRPGERVLDAAAAPGGKTSHMAELMGDGGLIEALDIDGDRIARMKENIERLGLASIRISHADILAWTPGPGSAFDRVLLDAPCSSLGVIRRNPDIKYRRTEKNLDAFHEKQYRMLLAASRFLKRGGSLVYSVCSTEPEEGEDVIGRFLLESETGTFVIDTPRKVFSFLAPFLDEKGCLRTYPHRHDMDGFFAARLRKIA
jgi:16S rRNA (cytosine967-C5)-methyltransferase